MIVHTTGMNHLKIKTLCLQRNICWTPSFS